MTNIGPDDASEDEVDFFNYIAGAGLPPRDFYENWLDYDRFGKCVPRLAPKVIDKMFDPVHDVEWSSLARDECLAYIQRMLQGNFKY